MSNFIYIDRRKTGRGKSLPNRQRLLKRIKDSIRNTKPEDFDDGGVQATGAGQQKTLANPVKVARDALIEPTFNYARGKGEHEIVLIGNDKWLKGDEFPLDDGEGDGGGGEGNGPGEDGEDDFIINISRNEFFDVFFEDCELPDLQDSQEKTLPEAQLKPAGFQKSGTPGQLSVKRSFKNAIGRRRALTKSYRDELEALLLEKTELEENTGNNVISEIQILRRIAAIIDRIVELEAKIAGITLFEDIDLRYRKTERVEVKIAEAVLMMLMDISGSMDEAKKRTSRKFFSLQYAFIKRKYPQTDLVFIKHTDKAEEVDELDFFTTRKNGGTVVSPALVLAHKIVKERYDSTQTNIYISYAGDGDNWDSDNKEVQKELEEEGLLAKIRHFVYIQVGAPYSYMGMNQADAALMNIFLGIAKKNKKMDVVKVETDDRVFPVFKSVYKKKKSKP